MTALATRLQAARAAMTEAGIEAMLLSVGSDLPYLTGYRAMPLERITMLVLPQDGEAVLVVPELEAPRVPTADLVSVHPWQETADPIGIIARLVGSRERIAIGDQTWASFLIELQRRLPGAAFESATPLMTRLRVVKTPDEVDRLAAAAASVDRVVALLADERFSGRTERELARWVAARTKAEGHETVEFTIVASGPNAASPHHDASDREIIDGDLVVVDFGGRMDGYCSDTTRTFAVGEVDPERLDAYRVLESAHEAAVAAVQPGVPAEDIDRAARTVLTDGGYGAWFIHRTGHGIGLDAHEHPYIVAGNQEPVLPGMSFSIEPGIYRPDRWGMRIEDIVVVTPTGVEQLNRSARHLYAVD